MVPPSTSIVPPFKLKPVYKLVEPVFLVAVNEPDVICNVPPSTETYSLTVIVSPSIINEFDEPNSMQIPYSQYFL